jgi:hypothetical protein
MQNSMTCAGNRPSTARPLVSAEDDPLFSADHAHCPSGAQRRASISVGEVEEIARRAAR